MLAGDTTVCNSFLGPLHCTLLAATEQVVTTFSGAIAALIAVPFLVGFVLDVTMGAYRLMLCTVSRTGVATPKVTFHTSVREAITQWRDRTFVSRRAMLRGA